MTRLQVLRVQRNLSQLDLGKLLGYSNSCGVCQVEKNPRLDNPRISKNLRKRLELFFGEPFERLIEPVDLTRALAA